MGRERQDGGLMEPYTQAAREAASPEAMGASCMWVLKQGTGTSHRGQ